MSHEYLEKKRLSNKDRLLFVLLIPVAVLLSISPWLMLLLSVTVLPVGFGIYWMVRFFRYGHTRQKQVNFGSRQISVAPAEQPRIKHHWTMKSM